jgi:hypothetical protein
MWPNAKQPAPLNSHIWVRLPAFSAKWGFGRYPIFKSKPSLWASSFQLKQLALDLQLNGKSQSGLLLRLQSTQWRMIILQPKYKLSPGQTYTVRLRVGPWAAPIGSFKTTSANAPAPTAIQLSNARLVWNPQTSDPCPSPTPYAVVGQSSLPNASNTPLLGLWYAPPGGTINYKAPPNLILSSQKKQFVLGRHTQCAINNFDFQQLGSSVTIGARLGNLAGQWGTPQTTTFTISNPTAPWTWSPSMRIVFWGGLTLILLLLSLLRSWLFQRKSLSMLEDFLANYSTIKSDVAWLALRKLVEKETPTKRISLVLMIVQFLVLLVGLYAFVMSLFQYAVSKPSMTHLLLLVGPMSLFVLMVMLVHVVFGWRVSVKRHEIATLPIAESFRAPCNDLLKGWKKRGKSSVSRSDLEGSSKARIQSAKK